MVRNNRKSLTHDRIMTAAVAQFAEKGYDAASIQSIVEKADVAHGTLFWHFGSKEKLYIEVARWAGNQFYEAMHAIFDQEGPPPSIVELAMKHHSYLKENPHIGHISLAIHFEALGPHPELANAMRLFDRRVTAVWREWAARCAEAGLLRPGFDPKVVGALIAATLQGVNVGSFIHKWDDARPHFETVAKIFQSGCFIEGSESEAALTHVRVAA